MTSCPVSYTHLDVYKRQDLTFSCEKNVILEAVNTVIKVVPSKSSIPVLEGIFVEITDDKKIRLVGSDIDIGIETFRALDNAERCV